VGIWLGPREISPTYLVFKVPSKIKGFLPLWEKGWAFLGGHSQKTIGKVSQTLIRFLFGNFILHFPLRNSLFTRFPLLVIIGWLWGKPIFG